MANAIAKQIESLVFGLFSEMLSHGKSNLWNKIKYLRFNRTLSKWIRQFINANDGTILTTGDFESYLTHHGPVKRVFDAVIGDNPLETEEALVEDLIIKFKQVQSKGKMITCQDEIVLKDLFCGIYHRIDRFYRMQLSDSDRYAIAQTKKAKGEIVDFQKKGTAEVKQEVLKIQDFLKERKQIKSEDARWIYEAISKLLAEGKAEAIHILLPLLNENTGDLQYAIPYLIQLMSNYDVGAKTFSEIQQNVMDGDIYSDIVRKTIYYSLISDSAEILHQVSGRNPDLKLISENLVSKKYETFFNLIEEEQNGIKTINIKVQNNYPNERWLVLRICATVLSQKQVKNAPDVVNQLLGSDQTITDRILYFERKSIEIQSINHDNTDAAEKLYEELINVRTWVDRLPNFLQIKYYTATLRVSILISAEKGQSAVDCIPQKIQNNKDIAMLCMQVSIMNGNTDVEQVVQLCVQNDQYWLFNNYLIQFKSEPAQAKGIIENYKFILSKDVSVFLIYVQIISMTEGKENGKTLLESYEKQYLGYLEYWVEKASLSPKEEALDILKYIRNQKDLYSCSPQTRIALIRMLYDYECYEEALCEIEREGAYNNLVAELMHIKALALLKTKKEIEALEAFDALFAVGWHKDEIIFYLLTLSNRNNREVDEKVLKVAIKSTSAQVLLFLSNYYESHQDLDLAEKLLLRSMFYSDGKLIEVYGNYLRLHNTISKSNSIECEMSDINTVMCLASDNSKYKIVYCIHGSDVLPSEPFECEEVHHIYKDTAIRMGLYRKKVGATIVLNDTKFTITELLTLDCYLFRLSMQKTIDAGKAKCIHMSIDDEGKLDVEALKQELFKNISQPSDEPNWLSLYTDMSAVPISLFFAKQFVRLNYMHLTLVLLRDTDIIMRELACKQVLEHTQFILSFTSLLALHEIGFSPESSSADLTISASTLKEIDIEVEQLILDNSREHVASVGVHEGQLYFNESSEETKQSIMQSAVSIKEFAHKFITVENNKDFQLNEDPKFDCKAFFGICDYDTLAIATEGQHTLVTFEAVISAFATFSGIDVKTVGIADFLSTVCNDPNKLVDYVQKMLELRFMLPFTSAILQKISTLYKTLSEQEQMNICQKWAYALNIPLHDENYKGIIAEHARNVYVQTYETIDSFCPIWTLFAKYTLQYLGYTFEWYLDPNGKIVTNLVSSHEG